MLCSFLLGYRREALTEQIENAFSELKLIFIGLKAEPEERTSTEKHSGNKAEPKAGEANYNPYGALMRQMERGNRPNDEAAPSGEAPLARTLDSIQPGEISPEREARRNLYFDTLSNQMKRMQEDARSRQAQPQAIQPSPFAQPVAPTSQEAVTPNSPYENFHSEDNDEIVEDVDSGEEAPDEADTEFESEDETEELDETEDDTTGEEDFEESSEETDPLVRNFGAPRPPLGR